MTECITRAAADFHKGDIVQNIFAGKNNPTRFLLFAVGKEAENA